MKGRHVWSWSIMMCNCAFYFVQAKDYTCNLEVFIVMAPHLYGLSMCVKARDENSLNAMKARNNVYMTY
ncbi:hypothetical protein BVRB_4g078950 [Beta vulgaris subsp. vulgaris]|nr:hypothetical protein BVRB_4g078950 [Beta vulgaris subsp. vulgaris]